MNQEQQYREKTDEELVALTLESQENFAYLVERYREKLLRYIRRISAVYLEGAEDILQEIFIKAYTNLRGFDAKLKFSSWIYRIAHNTVISHYRKVKARPQSVSLEDANELALERLTAEINIEKDVDTKILREQIEIAFGHIDVKYKEVLYLRFFEEKSYEEISDILKKPKGTVATLLNRAKKKCRVAFEKNKR